MNSFAFLFFFSFMGVLAVNVTHRHMLKGSALPEQLKEKRGAARGVFGGLVRL